MPSVMDACDQSAPGGPDRHEGTAASHTAGGHTPVPSGYDAELRRHNEVLRRAFGIQPHDHVLDIGCGTGQTTRQAARMAQAGSALGIDISAPAIERARDLARAERLDNVTFEHADAQEHRFAREHFDLVISRFGTMFFDDPGAAFTNIRQALRPGGRLVMMAWQAHEHNEWDVTIREALAVAEGSTAAASEGPDPFSLAHPPTVKEILETAGFTGVTFTAVHEPVYYGPDVTAALDWIRGFACTNEILKWLDPAAAARALGRLREALAARQSDDGVWFSSRAWIITARRHRQRTQPRPAG